MVINRAGYAETTRLSQRLQPCRDVDSVAVDRAVFARDHVPKVDADAELHAPVLGKLAIAPVQRLLDLRGAFNGLNCTVEHGQHAVAGRIDYAPAMTCTVLRKDLAVLGEGSYGSCLVVSHQAGIASYIGGENGGKLTISFHCALR
jgi:hypothetical protein